MRKLMNFFSLAMSMIGLPLVVNSCVDKAYDLEKIDSEITLGSENGLKVVLGSTRVFTFEEFMKDVDSMIQQEDGTYLISFAPNPISVGLDALNDINAEIGFDDSASSLKNIDIDVITVESIPDNILSFISDDNQEIDIAPFLPTTETAIESSHDVNIQFEGIPDEIVSLKDIKIKNGAKLKITISAPECILTKGSIAPDFKVDMTGIFDIKGQTSDGIVFNGLTLSQENGFSVTKTYDINGLNISENSFDASNHTLNFSDNVKVSGIVNILDPKTTKARYLTVPKTITLNIKVEIVDVAVSRIEGCVDYEIDKVNASFDMMTLIDHFGFGAVNIDFLNPSIELAVKTNLGIPVYADFVFQPWKDGRALPESIETSIDLPYSISADQQVSCTYLFSKLGTASDGKIGVKADITDIIRYIPDSVVVNINAATVKTKEGCIELDKAYNLSVTPKVDVPVKFGKDLQIEYRDTISVSIEDVGKVINDDVLILGGKIQNNFPLNLDVDFEFVDEFFNPIIEGAHQTFKSNSQSDICFNLKKVGSSNDMSSVILHFNLTAGGDNVILKKDNSLQAIGLYLEAPEGITINIE